MARIRIAWRISPDSGRLHRRWLKVSDAEALRQKINVLVDREGSGAASEWEVIGYDGLPEFGPRPELNELVAYLDAVDEYGAPFEAWWASQVFEHVVQAADAFADRYQGTYADVAGWAHHYLSLMGEPMDAERDLDAYGRAAASKGEIRFLNAEGGGIHVFWND